MWKFKMQFCIRKRWVELYVIQVEPKKQTMRLLAAEKEIEIDQDNNEELINSMPRVS